jgi:hypothetical protein
MWTTDKPYYSEKNVMLMLKEASAEKLAEFMLMAARGE